MLRKRGSRDDTDPLDRLLKPPKNETPNEKIAREAKEREAKRINDEIENQLRADNAKMKKIARTTVKVLLLGQGESGKSTTLKNFRLAYAPQEFTAEKSSWKAVIHLNLIRAVLRIIEEVKDELDSDPSINPPKPIRRRSTSRSSGSTASSSNHRTTAAPAKRSPTLPNFNPVPQSPTASELAFQIEDATSQSLHDEIDIPALNVLLLRLSPLRGVEKELKKQLGGAAIEVEPDEGVGYNVLGASDALNTPVPRRNRVQEWAVRANLWRDDSNPNQDRPPRLSTSQVSAPLLTSLLDDLNDICRSPSVRFILERRGTLREIEDSAGGYFLNSLHRIISPGYVPTDQDIMRARLRTLGVQETRIWFGSEGTFASHELGREWVLYDVGGSRTMRNAWVPFFDNVHAIIFLAPISCFNERLAEDPRVNRLEDTIHLWRSVCASKLISEKTTLVLFLNKCDLLQRKLERGVRLRDFLPSYGDRDNSIKPATKYFKQKFKDLVVQHSPHRRVCYIYPTSVTDTTATRMTLETVRDGIIREHLKHADFL